MLGYASRHHGQVWIYTIQDRVSDEGVWAINILRYPLQYVYSVICAAGLQICRQMLLRDLTHALHFDASIDTRTSSADHTNIRYSSACLVLYSTAQPLVQAVEVLPGARVVHCTPKGTVHDSNVPVRSTTNTCHETCTQDYRCRGRRCGYFWGW